MPQSDTIVLISGGLDSAVLLAHEACAGLTHPTYVSVGLAWEAGERRMLARLLSTPAFAARVAPLAALELGMRDVYPPTHWAITGRPPAYDTPDEDVYLLGRNLVLLTKAGVMAATNRANRVALGPLAGNPFPDARPAFFAAMSRAMSLGLDREIDIATPFAHMRKEDVIRLGAELGVPFELTLSCMNPVDPSTLRHAQGRPEQGRGATSSGSSRPFDKLRAPSEVEGAKSRDDSRGKPSDLPLHCGQCSKCRERRDGFAAAGVLDPTPYAAASPR